MAGAIGHLQSLGFFIMRVESRGTRAAPLEIGFPERAKLTQERLGSGRVVLFEVDWIVATTMYAVKVQFPYLHMSIPAKEYK